MTTPKYFLISGVVFVVGVVVIVIFLSAIDSPPSADSDELESQALAAEGTFISTEMERANRDHDWSRVNEIRQRNADFKRRSADYLARHGRTSPPER